MIEVKLINKEYIRDFFKNYGEFSCVCYNTPKEYADKVGRKCLESGHLSGSRCEYFKFEISGVSRACSLQLNRHNVGTVLNQQSQRYVDMKNTEFVVPLQIKNNERALEVYNRAIDESKKAYLEIQSILLEAGRTKEQANEDARYALLESCETKGTWAFTIESLIHLMNKRLCLRSQLEIRQLVNQMRKEVLKVLPELEQYLVPDCKDRLYCIEEKCCGLMPKKSEAMKILNKNSIN